MTFEEIRACLTADGWPVDVLSETTMQSRFRGKARIFPVLIHVDEAFVTIAVLPYAHAPEDAEDADDLLRQLLRFNRQMNLAKFSMDEDDDVVLSVEYRLADLDPSEVRDAMDVVSFYADQYHDEVERLARP
ncbi:MAG: YbjN domain-containing protein [Polyangiaceae bacterium]